VVFAGSRDGLAAGGKAVIVCDVEVIEDVVLPVLAIFAFYAILVVRLSRRNFSRVKLYRETPVVHYHHVVYRQTSVSIFLELPHST
jgi:predicted cation transporter